VRDIQRNPTSRGPTSRGPSFYSRSRETYSGTWCRCQWSLHQSQDGFYSLSCETYSGTFQKSGGPGSDTFLFAVVRDVQRNTGVNTGVANGTGFYSLSCETYSGTDIRRILCPSQGTSFYSLSCETYSGTTRRRSRLAPARSGFYSLSCETYSGTAGSCGADRRADRFYSLSCETYSGTSRSRGVVPPACFYSLSCETYSGTGRGAVTPSPGCRRFYSLSCETYSGTVGQRLLSRPLGPSFYSLSCETYSGTRRRQSRGQGHHRDVSIRCRARRTAELVKRYILRAAPQVSIRCRVRRTAEPQAPSGWSTKDQGFYSLSCETYSGTGGLILMVGSSPVSIRCRARRTAEPRRSRGPVLPRGFYSLSCETYSGTSTTTVAASCVGFLFAVVRDVQRNGILTLVDYEPALAGFLFAVVRDVQRNHRRAPRTPSIREGFYSLSCETYSGTGRCGDRQQRPLPFLFAVVRDVQRNCEVDELGSGSVRVSIRCRARRTAEPPHEGRRMIAIADVGFLFAVVRDVQRNRSARTGCRSSGSFYSLSCETYSGTYLEAKSPATPF